MEIIETNLQFNSNMTERKNTKRGIFHNSGTAVRQAIDIIHNYHKNTRGYAGIGYHFYIRRDGSIYRGRQEHMQGAHAYGANSDSIGICFEGNLNEEYLTREQIEAGRWLVSYLKGKYENIEFTEHRKVCNTSCPGKKFNIEEIVNVQVNNQQVSNTVDERKERIKTLQSLLNKVYNAGLAVDGIIGTNTNNALRRVALKNYCANELVKFVQQRLIMNGRSIGNCGVDGKYGKDTESAVRKFQSEKGLAVDGIAGINTIKALI